MKGAHVVFHLCDTSFLSSVAHAHRGKRWTLSTPGAHRSNGREFELAQIINFYEASEFSGEVVG